MAALTDMQRQMIFKDLDVTWEVLHGDPDLTEEDREAIMLGTYDDIRKLEASIDDDTPDYDVRYIQVLKRDWNYPDAFFPYLTNKDLQ